MSAWEQFEIECTEYLNNRFGAYAKFVRQGGADSTVSDIRVETKTKEVFYIEAKHSPAQCGQFVLLPDVNSRTFTYSSQNANHINIYAQKIMEHMNTQFDDFKEAGTAGKDIIMPKGFEVFSDWIIDTYQSKGTRCFITNNYTIIPIEKLKDYFNVTAKYRVKRSGSSSVGKGNIPSVLSYINNNNCLLVQDIRTDGNKLFVASSRELHNRRFVLGSYEYMFSLRDSAYEVRKLSNTFNANVIFSIELKSSKEGISVDEFIEMLK